MNWQIILLGCAGGLIPDVLRIIGNRYSAELPGHLKTVNFWLGLILLVALGGLAAWLGGATDAKTALAFGFGAPEIVSRLLASGPTTLDSGGSATRRWWAF
jgi:hypothetical protein